MRLQTAFRSKIFLTENLAAESSAVRSYEPLPYPLPRTVSRRDASRISIPEIIVLLMPEITCKRLRDFDVLNQGISGKMAE
jgi:hypothetical protein